MLPPQIPGACIIIMCNWMFFFSGRNLLKSESQRIPLYFMSLSVPDTIPPVVMCPDDISTYLSGTQTATTVTWTDPTPSETANISSTRQPGESYTVGTHAVVYSATDSSGNTGQCFFYVIVTSNISFLYD